jgi:hypothetical protein
MTLHETWAAAKKQAWKEFKEAQKNYLKDLDKKIKAPLKEQADIKARSKAEKNALDLALGEVGLDKGESLDDYLKFADGFGKQLDAFEKSVENNAKLNAKYDLGADPDKVIANKDLLKQLLLFCQRSHITSEISFYLQGYKKSPDEIWNQYIKPNAPEWFDVGVDERLPEQWAAAAQDPTTLAAQGPKLVQRTRDLMWNLLKTDIIPKMRNDATANKNLGLIHSDVLRALKAEIKETAKKYSQQIQSAVNKWSKLKPQFWRPLDDALEEIQLYLEKH